MKLFFSDLDGTLLTSGKTISPATKQAVDDFVNAGNIFVISTGRALSSALKLRDHYGLNYPGSYLSSFNGGILYDNTAEKVISRTALPLEVVAKVQEIADEYHIYLQTYSGDYILARYDCEELRSYMHHTNMETIFADDLVLGLEDEPCKMLAIDLHDHAHLQEFRRAVEDAFGGSYSIVSSEPEYVELCPPDAGKGKALERLCGILQIPVRDSLAAGDAENDIPMLVSAGTGIAMINASDAVKAAADVVTAEDNDHDGLLPYLQP